MPFASSLAMCGYEGEFVLVRVEKRDCRLAFGEAELVRSELLDF